MKQVEVKILQQSYLLACKEGQETRLSDAVRLVDDAMTRIHDAGKVRARERIAVLAALNLAYELGDLRQAHEQLQSQLPAVPDEPTASHAQDTDMQEQLAAQTVALQTLVAKLSDALQEHTGQEQDTDDFFTDAVMQDAVSVNDAPPDQAQAAPQVQQPGFF
ncbi:cell division protein ZapA [Lampropedia puyangensis]|uniref:Cell division protein ZapA n=1 Tax=Lampropedia puyangensis TaxID=1330072 RepID=A0A4S8FD98_9BURK|nr:cell division protein ZapA [Lampropedia puyangensis]